MKKTKTQMVKDHLIKKGVITSWEAIKLYKITRLAAIIERLRNKLGWKIETQPMKSKDENGNEATYAKYVNKTLMILLICMSSFIVKAQDYQITICKDAMTEKEYAFGSKNLLCSEDGKKGFIVKVSWESKNGKVKYGGLSVTSAGIGTCTEKDELIILFDDDTKYTATSWNEFNCKGNSWYDLYGNDFEQITKKIKAIRFTNGRTYESYTYKVPADKQDYFINAKTALSQPFITKNCE